MTDDKKIIVGLIAGWLLFFLVHAAMKRFGKKRPEPTPVNRWWSAAKTLFTSLLFAAGISCFFVDDYPTGITMVAISLLIRAKYM